VESTDFDKHLDKAVKRGVLVPILGFGVSTSPTWADAPLERDELVRFFGQQGGRSMQAAELHKIDLQTHLVSEALADKIKEQEFGSLASYLKNLRNPRRGCVPLEMLSQGITGLQKDVTFLGYVLTVVWAEGLKINPRPLGLDFADKPAGAKHATEKGLDVALRNCLNDCMQLWNSSAWKEAEAPQLRLEWIYEKLLLLAARIYATLREDFWQVASDPDFAGKHRDFIEYHESRCGWTWPLGEAMPLVAPCHHTDPGLHLSYVLWVEALRRHCLRAGTRAYRTRQEVAFLLALDNKIEDLPNVTADPFESGLVNRVDKEVEQDLKTLKDLYEFCSFAPDGSPRVPGALHQALARLVRQSDVNDRNQRASQSQGGRKRHAVLPSSLKCRQIILSMSLDLEMERAIEKEYREYRVMVPALVPLRPVKTPPPGRTPSPDSRRYGETWLLGEFTSGSSRDAREATGWKLVADVNEDAEPNDGPLIVKLFGSPLHELGTTSQFCSGYIDSEPALPLHHRVVVDEADLLKRLFMLLPKEAGGLVERVRSCVLFFFGQDAVTWSERARFFMVRAIDDRPIDSEDESDGTWGPVAVGDPGLAGGSALRRLNISLSRDSRDIAGLIMERASRCNL